MATFSISCFLFTVHAYPLRLIDRQAPRLSSPPVAPNFAGKRRPLFPLAPPMNGLSRYSQTSPRLLYTQWKEIGAPAARPPSPKPCELSQACTCWRSRSRPGKSRAISGRGQVGWTSSRPSPRLSMPINHAGRPIGSPPSWWQSRPGSRSPQCHRCTQGAVIDAWSPKPGHSKNPMFHDLFGLQYIEHNCGHAPCSIKLNLDIDAFMRTHG